MSQMDFWRQLNVVSPSDLADLRVTMIGVGGIGSPTILALAKMGVENITVFDPDTVEPHNLPNQMYRFSDLGQTKVEGISSICRDFAGVELKKVAERFNDHPLSGIVISGVDTMSARKEIWGKIRWNPSVLLYIEARMGAEVARIHSVHSCDPSEVRWYETTLYSDEQASEAPCTARAVIYNVFMIAALVANQVKKFAKGEDIFKEIIFDLATLILLTQ